MFKQEVASVRSRPKQKVLKVSTSGSHTARLYGLEKIISPPYLMQSAVLCYTDTDAKTATELTHFLASNCVGAVFDKELLVNAEHDLLCAAEQALSADYVLLLLSPNSVPRKWTRERWEPVLVDEARKFGTRIVYVLLAPCEFPRVFRLHTFFDLSEDRLAGQRALKRWLLQHTLPLQLPSELPDPCGSVATAPETLRQLECDLADRPGIQTDTDRETALTFARTHREDYEAVFWFNCANRSRAGILGDTARALGLRLRGPLEQNAEALHDFCGSKRILLVFENLEREDRELVTYGGSASVMMIAGQTTPAARSLPETVALFARWTSNFEDCLSALGDVQHHLRKLPAYKDQDWETVISLGSLASSLLMHDGRLAEAHEVLEWMIKGMRACGDLRAAQYEWEKSWILEEWGAPVLRTIAPPNQPVQLSLGFGD